MNRGYNSDKDIDQGWAWVVLCAVFISMLLYGMVQYSTGIIVAAMLDEMDADLIYASWVGSAHISVGFLTGPVAGVINGKLGCRLSGILSGFVILAGLGLSYFSTSVWSLMLTFALIGGFGYGLAYNNCYVATGQYFHRLRAVTTGFMTSGIALGIFIGPVTIRALMDEFTLHGMFLIMGALCFNITALSILIRPSPFEKSKQYNNKIKELEKDNNKRMCCIQSACVMDFWKLLKIRSFLFYSLSIFSFSTGESMTLIQLPIYAEQQGSTKMEAATLFTAYGSGSIVGRLLIGLLANDRNINKALLQGSCLGITGLLILLFPSYSSSWTSQMIFSGAIGMFTGGIPALFGPLTVECVGLAFLASGFGFLSMMSGLTYAVVPALAGAVVEATGCMSYTFYLGGSVAIVGSLLAFVSGTQLIPITDDITEITVQPDPQNKHLITTTEPQTITNGELRPLNTTCPESE
ncbi:monocarboxylate transporter 2 [Patella vulgata]|uniref:monocarboxylate transporter 2 n=1 Tax=Patella vulgata TaxID=6465 RepID=UPI00217FD061|nr:monocarboxylate transporter 2 [Patella vulgata]XP_050389195.1 monocarboxylate transporter 2 [Patella vulgata]